MSPLLHLCTAGEPLPPLAKILLQDNSIDAKGKGGTFGPVICMRAFRRLITSNPNFEEIDFEHNHIDDAAGREILHAMQQRKEVGYPSIRMTVTHRMNPVTFAAILDLSTTYGKKARGKKKKAKK
ncbi:uncharacterized protein [Dysidea avara]|uniref:uncharacterized protein isoform X3 n=1 Tax=Dysidea avara TaxID=196820 RepID=UPI003321304F